MLSRSIAAAVLLASASHVAAAPHHHHYQNNGEYYNGQLQSSNNNPSATTSFCQSINYPVEQLVGPQGLSYVAYALGCGNEPSGWSSQVCGYVEKVVSELETDYPYLQIDQHLSNLDAVGCSGTSTTTQTLSSACASLQNSVPSVKGIGARGAPYVLYALGCESQPNGWSAQKYCPHVEAVLPQLDLQSQYPTLYNQFESNIGEVCSTVSATSTPEQVGNTTPVSWQCSQLQEDVYALVGSDDGSYVLYALGCGSQPSGWSSLQDCSYVESVVTQLESQYPGIFDQFTSNLNNVGCSSPSSNPPVTPSQPETPSQSGASGPALTQTQACVWLQSAVLPLLVINPLTISTQMAQLPAVEYALGCGNQPSGWSAQQSCPGVQSIISQIQGQNSAMMNMLLPNLQTTCPSSTNSGETTPTVAQACGWLTTTLVSLVVSNPFTAATQMAQQLAVEYALGCGSQPSGWSAQQSCSGVQTIISQIQSKNTAMMNILLPNLQNTCPSSTNSGDPTPKATQTEACGWLESAVRPFLTSNFLKVAAWQITPITGLQAVQYMLGCAGQPSGWSVQSCSGAQSTISQLQTQDPTMMSVLLPNFQTICPSSATASQTTPAPSATPAGPWTRNRLLGGF